MATLSDQLRRAGGRLPEGLADAVWLWIVLRVGLGLLAILVVVQGTAAAPCTDPDLAFLPQDGLHFILLGVWQHWDACWYTEIAAFGYEADTGATNMFPLLPVLMGAVATTRAHLPLAAAAVNAVALVVALTGLRELIQRDFDRGVAERTVLYVAVFPAALFLIAPFTESLFLAATVWAFVGARTRRWEIAIVAGILAGLARPLGVLLVLPIGWEMARMLHERWLTGSFRARPGDVLAGLAVAAPVLAYLGFVAFTVISVGDPYFEANTRWGTHRLDLPWNRLGEAIAYSLDHQAPIQLLSAAAWTLFLGLALAGIRLLPVSYWIFVLPQLALMLTQDTNWPMMATIRYLGVLFPCLVVLAIAGRHPRIHVAWTVLSVLLLAFMTILFVEGRMVG